jgi:hypothetical protein
MDAVGMSRTSRAPVRVELDATRAVVLGRRGRRLVRETHEGAPPGGAAVALRKALKRSALLRPGAARDIRILWEPVHLSLRMERPEHRDEGQSVPIAAVDAEDLGPDHIVSRLRLWPGSPGLVAMVRRCDVEELAAALASSRFEGTARLEVGVVERLCRVLEHVGTDGADRSGFVVDVTSSHIFVFRILCTGPVDVRSAPAQEPSVQVGVMLRSLLAVAIRDPLETGASATSSGSRPWFSVHASPPHLPHVRAACAATLPPGSTADLLLAPAGLLTAPAVERTRGGIAAWDLLAEHPARVVGAGSPRILRLASSIVLVGAVAGVGLTAIAAIRAPLWTVDLAASASSPEAPDVERARGEISHSDFLRLLQVVDGMEGVRVETVDVRRKNPSSSASRREHDRMVASLRLMLVRPDTDLMERVEGVLAVAALDRFEVLDFAAQADGAAVALTVDVRTSTSRSGSSFIAPDPRATLPALLESSGVELVAIRLPATADTDRQIHLICQGPLDGIIAVLESIEGGISSSGRIDSMSIRKQGVARAVLDLRFTARDPSSFPSVSA